METILNLAWVAITVAAMWLWRFRWTVSRQNPRHSTRVEVVAIVCVLALLFPVISLTDDLHPEIVPADTVSSKRNHCLLVAQGAQGGNSRSSLNVHFFFVLVSHSSAEIGHVFAVLVSPTIPHPHSASSAFAGRSPPSRG
jgi:hypothetical protein